jgi:recombination protein RecR
MNAIDELTDCFARLPGIGKKSAGRLVNYILKADSSWVKTFARQLSELQDKIKPCSVCGCWTENDPCPVCSNPLRDNSLICVVEQPQDAAIIENAHEFNGVFHVLGGVIAPLEGIGPDQLRIKSLLGRVQGGSVKEVILATNPTVEGDTTAMYIQKVLSAVSDVKITRLASGLPVGGDLEYIDKLTLARSFRGRSSF